jgi:large subunit ribosomal protein L3
MINTILGSKIKMGQTFVQGVRLPVTYIKAGPCVVTQVKKEEKDGYWAIQIGFRNRRIKNITKPQKGHLKAAYKSSKTAARYLREVKFNKEPKLKVGDKIKVADVFKKGDVIAITGTSKGKGFQGVMKRWGFAGGPRTHGQSDRQRSPGSIGQGTDPGRVWKGKKMAGRMGGNTVTIKNLVVIDVDGQNNKVLVSGPVPGNNEGLLKLTKIESGGFKRLVQHVEQVAQIEEKAEVDTQDNKPMKGAETQKIEDTETKEGIGNNQNLNEK